MGDWLLISGQIGIRPDGSVPTGLREQTALVFGHLKAAVESEGMSMGDIVKFTTYLTEASQAAEFSAAREELFAELYPEGGYPANTTVVVKGLVLPELLIEIEAIAHA